MTSNGIIMVLQTLKKHDNNTIAISKLFLHDNPFDDSCLIALAELLQRNKTITTVNISGRISDDKSNLTDNGLKIFCPLIAGNNTALRVLNLSNNKSITKDSVPVLIDMIEKSNIEEVYVNKTSITDKSVFAIPLAANKMKNGSERITFSQSNVSDVDLIKMSAMIRDISGGTIKELK